MQSRLFVTEFGEMLSKEINFVKQLNSSYQYLMDVTRNIYIGIYLNSSFADGVHVSCNKCFKYNAVGLYSGLILLTFDNPNIAKDILEFQKAHNHDK